MPTYNRREFIPLALKSYLAQDWREKELIVIDDGTDRVEELFRGVPDVRYFFLEGRSRIGAKRNRACEVARGEFIVHWDDDDWSAAERISDQVSMLITTRKAVAGYSGLPFWDGAVPRRYANESAIRGYGSSLCYRRGWWEKNNFPATSFGEDFAFIERATEAGELIVVDSGEFMVARMHSGNSCERAADEWPVVDALQIPAAFMEAIADGKH